MNEPHNNRDSVQETYLEKISNEFILFLVYNNMIF